MADIHELPLNEDREWRMKEQYFRNEIIEKGAKPGAVEEILTEFRGYFMELHYPKQVKFHCDEELSDLQVESLFDVAREIQNDFWVRIAIAEDIILDLLVEKRR
ncbi:hypothetical protein BWR15_14695 [Pseudomonas sp. T]|nr:hypothetical protein BWR15_14695 [Pseudomonas sp. T]